MQLLKIDDMYINPEHIEGFRIIDIAVGSTIHIFPVGNTSAYVLDVKESGVYAEKKLVYILTEGFAHTKIIDWNSFEGGF